MTIQSLHSFKYENSKIIFPFSGKWIMLLFSLVAIACTNEKTLNEKINTLYSTPIVFPESGLLRVDGSSIVPYQEKLSESRYNMVVFHSQTECTVCALEKMSDWNALLNWERDGKGKLTFIFSPSSDKFNEVVSAYRRSGLEHEIVIDTCGIFLKENTHIPKERAFHTFLLNRKGEVMLVGNPIYNEEIKKLFYKRTAFSE